MTARGSHEMGGVRVRVRGVMKWGGVISACYTGPTSTKAKTAKSCQYLGSR